MSSCSAPTKPTRRRLLLSPVSELESEIVLLLDERGGATVRDVHEILRERRHIAYTTCVTVMSNLTRKGFLRADCSEAAYRYRPRVSARKLGESLLDAIVARFWAGDRGPAVAHLLGCSGPLDAERLSARRKEAETRFQPKATASVGEVGR